LPDLFGSFIEIIECVPKLDIRSQKKPIGAGCSIGFAHATGVHHTCPSDHPVEYVLVELKPGAPKAKGWPVELDPVKLEPKYEQVPLENSRVRVLRTILEPHLKGPTHDHPSYVVVYLTELHTTMKLADGRLVDNPRRPGEVDWRDPLKHETENIGEHTAVELQIELK